MTEPSGLNREPWQGLLMQEPDEDFAALARRYGRRRAGRIWELSRTATRRFVGVLRDLDIRCGLAQRDSVYYALAEDAAARFAGGAPPASRRGHSGAMAQSARPGRATPYFKPLAARFRMMNTSVVATRPLTPASGGDWGSVP
jgi:hypothetical protein